MPNHQSILGRLVLGDVSRQHAHFCGCVGGAVGCAMQPSPGFGASGCSKVLVRAISELFRTMFGAGPIFQPTGDVKIYLSASTPQEMLFLGQNPNCARNSWKVLVGDNDATRQAWPLVSGLHRCGAGCGRS